VATQTLTEIFQPARLGFTCLKYTEVSREICPVYSHRNLLFLKIVLEIYEATNFSLVPFLVWCLLYHKMLKGERGYRLIVLDI